MPDQSPIEARLYTLNEAADLTGLSVDALRQRIKRRKIQAHRGNDGLVRVRLDGDAMGALKTSRPPNQPPSGPSSRLDEQNLAIKALDAAVGALREQLARAEEREIDLRSQRDRAQAAGDQARCELQSERQASRRLQERIAELERQLEAAMAADAGDQSPVAEPPTSEPDALGDQHQTKRLRRWWRW